MFRFPSAALSAVLLLAVLALGWWVHQAPYLVTLTPMSDEQVLHGELGGDFRFFWAAGHLVATGQPHEAYQAKSIAAQDSLRELRPEQGIGAQPLLYPPFLLPALGALGALPFGEAWLVYEGFSLALLAFAVLLAFPRHPWALPVTAGFGGLWLALDFGQSTIILTALYLLVMACLPRKELRLGLVLALASFKPHLGVIVPVWLLLRRHWLAMFVAALALAGLVTATAQLYGWVIWHEYAAALRYAAGRLQTLETARPPTLVSTYAYLRFFGAGQLWALAGQGAVALLAVWGLVRVSRAAIDSQKPFAALILVTLLAIPHCYVYDLVLLLIPLLVLLKSGLERGLKLADIEVLLPLYLLPFYATPLNLATHLPFVPLLLLWTLRRLVIVSEERG